MWHHLQSKKEGTKYEMARPEAAWIILKHVSYILLKLEVKIYTHTKLKLSILSSSTSRNISQPNSLKRSYRMLLLALLCQNSLLSDSMLLRNPVVLHQFWKQNQKGRASR